KIANEVYQAGFENVDFPQKNQTANIINKWVEKQTANKIQNLINPDNLDDLTALILVNALYFKGTWDSGFFGSATKKKKFYKTAQDVVEVDTMHDGNKACGYYENKELNAKFLKLPFLGKNISTVLVLPNDKDGIAKLESQVDKVFVQHHFQPKILKVATPKFKIESATDFTSILKNLGVRRAFINGEADFSGMVNDSENLYINSVIQKTFIDVDEKGVEAAAASFVEMLFDSALVASGEFIADHPFIFYIEFNNLILFAGRVSAPEQ
ncbi:Serpin domain containing protein, partial [Asbolus verrucosus]